ncbi:MAG: hypothetical protein L0H70_04060 [Xanthomonadales bacterium]|nr:hypothetical protein [Xanthomonadales bacterium]
MHHNNQQSLSPRQRTPLRTPLVLALALVCAPLAAAAATISVTSAVDLGTTGTCTLRQAIVTMNDGTTVSAGDGEGNCRTNASGNFGSQDTIVFGLGAFPADGSDAITLSGVVLTISAADLAIDATANSNVTIDANHTSGVMVDRAALGELLTLKHLTLINGNVADPCDGSWGGGGGICIPHANLVLAHVTVSGNSVAGFGGGIFAYFGSVSLTASTVSDNSASSGGGISALRGDVSLVNSTLSGNAASYRGGGIVAYGGSIALVNSTLSGNTATESGGGIFNTVTNGSVTLTDSTLSDNSAGSGGGIGSHIIDVTLIANNAIVAGNIGGDLGGDVFMTGGEYNLIGNVTHLELGPLQDNGGPTQTMLPQRGSAAIDSGACSGGVPTTDQRGVSRPQGASCDIGAVEVLSAVSSFSDSSAFAHYGQPRTWVLTLVNRGAADASGVTVQGNAPPQIDAGATRWRCIPSFGAICTAYGSGALNDANVFIPAHGVVSWTITAPIKPHASGGTLTMTANVTGLSPAATVEDTDTLVLFRDGFDVPAADGTMAVLHPATR